MKKRQNNSARASALQFTLSVALLSVSAILFASSFRAAAPAGPFRPQSDVVAATGPVSQNLVLAANVPAAPRQDGFYPPLPVSTTHRQDGFYPPLPLAPQGALITVSLPIASFDTSVPSSTIIIQPVTTTLIDNTTTEGLNYVGFQGDFTFDSAVVTVLTVSPGPTQGAGLTAFNWNVSGNVFDSGQGTTKTLRILAFSNVLTPLNGSGTLFNVRMLRVSNMPGDTSPMVWAADPDSFLFIDDNLFVHTPNQTNGLITITGVPTPTPTPSPGACVWSAAPVMPIPILDEPVTTVGSNLYTFAGVSNDTIQATSHKFDGTTWTTIAPLPVAVEFPAAVNDGTNIYVMGGSDNGGVSQATLYRYNVAANT